MLLKGKSLNAKMLVTLVLTTVAVYMNPDVNMPIIINEYLLK